MLKEAFYLLLIFIIFAIIMISIIQDKKIKYSRIILSISIPVILYISCNSLNTAVQVLLKNNIILTSLWYAIKWIICASTYTIAGITIFKTVTKSEQTVLQLFTHTYKKWNVLIVVFILLATSFTIINGIDLTIHQQEYIEAIYDMIKDGKYLDSATGGFMARRIFSALITASQAATLICVFLPSILLAKKSN